MELEESKDRYLAWFHKNLVFHTTKWLGRPIQKTPFDVWIIQEIICDTKPKVIIEIGNASGGSALYFASIFDCLGFGRIIGIDINSDGIKDLNHNRITWITGDATDNLIFKKVQQLIKPDDKIMVIEDSSHTYDSTLTILEKYSQLVSEGYYFIVEDTICKEEYITDGPKPGPYEAVHKFLETHSEFKIDKTREKFYLTYNPDGYLLKIKKD